MPKSKKDPARQKIHPNGTIILTNPYPYITPSQMLRSMMKRGFRSLVVSQGSKKGEVSHEVVHATSLSDLPFQPPPSLPITVVNISWSTINYKDGLVLQGKPGVAKQFPLVPGIDCAGEVESCSSNRFSAGDKVVLTGNYLGQHMDGCYSEKVKVPTDWLVPLPPDLTEKQSMVIGTAGFTAMQSVMSLERFGNLSKDAEILVTGSSGGVGSTAVSILGKLGYRKVTASTGRVEENEAWLKRLGAAQVVGRVEASGKALGREKWDACVDTVGGDTLATVLAETKYGGVVTCCGLAQSPSLKSLTVMPFILRGVKLIGIDSVQLPMQERQEVWRRLAKDFPREYFQEEIMEAALEDLEQLGEDILSGKVTGRVLVTPKAKL